MKRLKRGEIERRQGEGKVPVPLFLLWNAVSGKQSSPVLIIHQSVHNSRLPLFSFGACECVCAFGETLTEF